VNKIFYDEDGRLRSGWRALIFLLAYFLISGIAILAFLAARGETDTTKQATGFLPLLFPFAAATATAILLGWGLGRLFEKVPFDALGVSLRGRWLRNLGLGAALGTVTIALAIMAAIATGSMSLAINQTSAGWAIVWNLATTFLVFFVGAASEETLFRGYLLQTFVRSKIELVGVALTALLFAFAHNSNPNINGIAWLNTFIAGIWFAAAYLKTRDLWFPFGIHLAWNWLQGPVFGINVSGIGEFSPDPLMRAHDAGPAWLTGGAYGLEGGIACTFALILSVFLIWFLPAFSTTEAQRHREHI
jgi:uncharacterized protein